MLQVVSFIENKLLKATKTIAMVLTLGVAKCWLILVVKHKINVFVHLIRTSCLMI